MKPLISIAAVSVLAVSAWAVPATGPAGPISASFGLAAWQGASCPAPAAAVPADKMTWKHGLPEYNDYNAAAKATDNTQKAQLAAAFVQKYPDSDYKNPALEMEMGAQVGVPSLQPQAVQTAEQLIKSGTATSENLLRAYVVISYVDPNLVQQNDPDMAAKMTALSQAATCGQQLLANAPADQQAQYNPILTKALGFAQLNQKNYSDAIATLTKATQQNSKEPLPYYWLGIAEVTQSTPNYNNGIFDLARASVLSPQTDAIKNYLNTVYTSYHGSADGLQDVITAATNNTAPPAGFTVMSKVDVENADAMAKYNAAVAAQKNALPDANTFAGIEARLKRPELAANEWKQVKGQGYELQGIVTAVTAKSADLAVGNSAASDPQPDVRLILFTPLKKLPKVGEKVTFSGEVLSFKPNPPDPNAAFMLTMDKGTITGYSPTAAKGQ